MTIALAVVFAFAAQAQRMTLTSGSFKALSGQSEVNVVYKYDGMKVGIGKKAVPEDEYIEKKLVVMGRKTINFTNIDRQLKNYL